MSSTKRIDPRRPYHITASGLRRIILGETGHAMPEGAATGVSDHSKVKPLRQRTSTVCWLMAVVHTSRGRLDEHARQAVAAAAILAAPDTGVLAVVLGELHENLGPLGADRVAVLADFDVDRFQPEAELAAVNSLIEAYKPQHVFLPDNASGDCDLGRRLIAAHNDAWAAHAIEIDSNHVATPWSGGTSVADRTLPRFVLLEAGAVDPALPFAGSAEIVPPDEMTARPRLEARIRDLGFDATPANEIALEEADFIVSAGNGVRSIATLETLAASLGAAVGASRVAVDEGKLSREKQIGATGKTVSASAYIAVGISGAVQHLQGIKDCRHVIAVNRDSGAPIVKRADLTVVGDAEDVMQALITRIAQARAQREIPEAT